MRKQITFAIITLLIITGLSSCQKDDGNGVVNAVVGQWKVSKIETTVAGTAAVTYTGVPSDSFEFRYNDENELVVNLKGINYVGSFVVLEGKLLNFTYAGKLRTSKITNLSDNTLEFTAKVDGETVETTEKYYLNR